VKLQDADRLFTTADAVDRQVLAVRGAEGAELGASERKDLLTRARAGEPVELVAEAVTYIQRETPNRNFVRFRAGLLRAFARSFRGQPVLRDHSQHTLADRGGTIESSELIQTKEGPAIKMSLRLVKGWAVEGALDGTLDRFSIGWSSNWREKGNVTCSICEEALWGGECSHWPGESYDGIACEAVIQEATGTEVSAVNVPAVVGTGIDGIRAALSALGKSDIQPGAKARAEEKPMKHVNKLLGLAAEASEEAAGLAVEKLQGELGSLKERLAIAEKAVEEAKARLETEKAAKAAADADVLVEQALSEGRVTKDQVTTIGFIRRLAGEDLAQARLFVAELKQVVPLDKAPASSAPPAPTPKAGVVDVNHKALKMLGVSAEDIEKHGPKEGAL